MTNYADRMRDLLSSGLTKSRYSNIYKLLQIFDESLDQLETVVDEVPDTRYLHEASDRSLDYLLDIFNLTRHGGESDDDFRRRFYAILARIHSCGTVDDLKTFISWFGGVDKSDIIINENPDGYQPPCFSIEIRAPFSKGALLSDLEKYIDQLKAAGVHCHMDDIIFWLVLMTVYCSTASHEMLVIDSDDYGWGHDPWGEYLWGSLSTLVSTAPATVTALP